MQLASGYYRGIKCNGKLMLADCVCLVTYRVKSGFGAAECAVVFVYRTGLENRMYRITESK